MIVVAAFDFDGTLARSDTVVPFLRRVASTTRLTGSLLPRSFAIVRMARRGDRDGLKALVTATAFTGRPAREVEQMATAYGAAIAATGLRDDTVGRLHWHLAAGHQVVIVSASYEPYLRVVATDLGGVDVLGTRLEVVDGVCTGRLDGENCRGPEKVARLEAWLAHRGLERSRVTVYAYGNSSGDDEMLAWSDHPHRANSPLASVAPTV